MPYFTDEELAKLPKWAQRRIPALEANAADANRNALAVTSPEGTSIEVNPYRAHQDQTRAFLPDGSMVRFYLPGEGDTPRGPYIDVRVKDGLLQLMASPYLTIYPTGGNTADVRAETWQRRRVEE